MRGKMTREERESQIRDQLKAGMTGINHEQAEFLIQEIDRLRAEAKEHANIHCSASEFIGIDGYGPFSMTMLCKDRWEIKMCSEKVILYNRKGHRVRGEIDKTNANYDGDW